MSKSISSRIKNKEELIETILNKGVEKIFPNEEFLRKKLQSGQKMTIYLGFDPTGPTLHLGHLIILKKMKDFQDLGHKIIILIGNFTGSIGDPTGKLSVRKNLNEKEIKDNYKGYKKQISLILKFSGENKAELKFNSKWLERMALKKFLEVASLETVQSLLKRDMFESRMNEGKPIYINEFLYPLLQGYDSVALNVDGEVGGNDQTFNMLVGRDLSLAINKKEKFVLAMKLLVDPEGKKMGKSENNMLKLSDSATEMYGKIMGWTDGMIVPGFELCTDMSINEVSEINGRLNEGENPKILKMELARDIVSLCYKKSIVDKTEAEFEKIFGRGEVPENIEEIIIEGEESIGDALIRYNIISSKNEWVRLIKDGAVKNLDNGEKIKDDKKIKEMTLKIGKRRFVKIVN